MTIRKWSGAIIAAGLSVALFVSGCGKTAGDEKTANDLAHEFMGDLAQTLIAVQNEPLELAREGVVVSSPSASYNTDALASFVRGAEGGSAQVTMAFMENKAATVFYRICFVNGNGYVLRAVYDVEKEDDLQASVDFVDSVSLEYDDSGVYLTTRTGKKIKSTYSFAAPVELEPEDEDWTD